MICNPLSFFVPSEAIQMQRQIKYSIVSIGLEKMLRLVSFLNSVKFRLIRIGGFGGVIWVGFFFLPSSVLCLSR